MKVYGCGGTGLNLVSKLEDLANGNKNIMLDSIETVYIDTSHSNLNPKIKPDRLYTVDLGMDSDVKGSGKYRPENYEPIKEQMKKILLTHSPQQFNIVVSSLSGGSGSVIAPVLVNELLSMGKDVVVIGVGSMDSTIEIHNTIKTIQSYAGISQNQNKPVVMFYYENSESTSRREVDTRVESIMVMLSSYLTSHNQELDIADIQNFLNYPKVTSHAPGLVAAQFFKDKIEVPNYCRAIACVTLAKPGDNTSAGAIVDYQAVGFVNDSAVADSILNTLPNHFTIVEGSIAYTLDMLNRKLKEIENIKAAAVVKKVVVSPTNNDGMSF